ncbi:hypothetical protein I2I05_03980 [Hymenobacter sp. BT683]|uniref:DUF3379 domain-containing protein n=1 Tax=Hymenobacter jeongseonensis TaxID=2791027 RepID=A0ABS0IED3_9BACT|nr:hypothetical protein [Hymenobacter jeongseonensis]MBF9236547.1 hypothetical protein [Hymenobacter jeongseonensis]
MKPPFKLDAHPRRPRPLLSEPPAGYFDQLPLRVMARLPHPDASEATAVWRWLSQLSPALRTSLASVAVLGGFVVSFYLSGPPAVRHFAAPTASLNAVSHAELVGYLLTSGAQVESADLAVLTAAHPSITQGFMEATDAELTEVLDAQPSEDLTYL